MIKEISNFIEKIPNEYFTENLEPSDGLHIWLELDSKGNLNREQYKSFYVKTVKKKKQYFKLIDEKLEETEINLDLALREQYSGFLTMNKAP